MKETYYYIKPIRFRGGICCLCTLTILIMGVLSSCKNSQSTAKGTESKSQLNTSKSMAGSMKATNDGTTTCQLVEKDSKSKNGKVVGKDLYLRCSIQDYFIKFCESDVTRSDLEKYIDRGITVKMEILQGEWDNCSDQDYPVQSRVGTYVAIKEIVE